MKRGPRAYQISCFNPSLFLIPSMAAPQLAAPWERLYFGWLQGLTKPFQSSPGQFCCQNRSPNSSCTPGRGTQCSGITRRLDPMGLGEFFWDSKLPGAGLGWAEGEGRGVEGAVPAGRSHQQRCVPSPAAVHPAALPDLPRGERGAGGGRWALPGAGGCAKGPAEPPARVTPFAEHQSHPGVHPAARPLHPGGCR